MNSRKAFTAGKGKRRESKRAGGVIKKSKPGEASFSSGKTPFCANRAGEGRGAIGSGGAFCGRKKDRIRVG